MKVTRIAYSKNLNHGKYARLEEQAIRLGRVRSLAWRLYSSIAGVRVGDRTIRDRWMRKHGRRGRNKTFTLTEGGDVWLAVPGLERRQLIKIPLNISVAPTGTLRLILRDGRVEVHHTIDAATMKSSQRFCGTRTIGVDKGYTEALTDSDGQHHGTRLGDLLRGESDHRKIKNARRAKLRSVAEQAEQRGDRAKAQRIRDHNLGTLKRERRSTAWECRIRDITFQAVHAVADAAAINILRRDGDPDITRYTPHTRVRQLLRERADRHRSRLPDQDSSTQHLCQCGERNIHPHPTMGKE